MDKEAAPYLPFIVYQNLQKFLQTSRLELVHGALQNKEHDAQQPFFLDSEKLTQDIQFYGFVMLEAKDAAHRDRRFAPYIHPDVRTRPTRTFIVLLAPDSKKHLESTHNFRKLLMNVPAYNPQGSEENLDIMIITPEDLSANLMKQVSGNSRTGGDGKGAVQIYNYRYVYFSSVIPENKSVPPHRIVPREKEIEVLKALCTDKNRLPKIQKSDSPCVWIGGEINDLIEIDEVSESTAIRRIYKVVIAAKNKTVPEMTRE